MAKRIATQLADEIADRIFNADFNAHGGDQLSHRTSLAQVGQGARRPHAARRVEGEKQRKPAAKNKL